MTMPNRYAWLALGTGAFLAFAVAMLPAAAAYRWVANDDLRLSGIDGTVWSGRAALASVGDLAVRDLRWSLDALPLLLGRVSARTQARLADGFVDTEFRASADGHVVLRNLQLSTNTAALAGLFQLGAMQGQVSVTLDRAEFADGQPIDAVGTARLGNLLAPTFMPTGRGELLPLGSYELAFEETGGQGILARFRDTGGPLEVNGTLQVDIDGRYRIEAAATPRTEAPPELVQGLELLAGPPDASGRSVLELTGSL